MKWAFLFLLLLLFLSAFNVSLAHNFNEGYSYAFIEKNTVEFELLLPFPVLQHYDLNGDGLITQTELDQQNSEISAYMEERLALYGNGTKMDYELISLQATYQEATETDVVQYKFRFTSNTNVEDLSIEYNVLFDDIDPTHQNYIQLYKDGNMIDHSVVYKDGHTFRYKSDMQSRFTPMLLGKYMLSGMQFMLRDWGLWLFSISILFFTGKLKTSLLFVTLFTIANMIGYIMMDKINIEFSTIWLNVLVIAAIFYFAVQYFVKSLSLYQKPFVLLFGFLYGFGAFSTVVEIGIYREFKTITLLSYSIGVLAAMAGLCYILSQLLLPLKKRISFWRFP